MDSKANPSIYLAYANHNRKKKGIQLLKNLYDTLASILIPSDQQAHVELDREDWDDKPFAFELFQEGYPFPNLHLIHLVAEGGEDETWYVNAPAGKRQPIDWDSLFFDHLKELKLIYIDGGTSLDIVEKLLFAGAPAVIATAFSEENPIASQFKTIFYRNLIQGIPLEEAYVKASESYPSLFTSKKIASDPYEYWEAKENEEQGEFIWGLYYLSASEKVLNWQLIEPGLVSLPPADLVPLPVSPHVSDTHDEQEDSPLAEPEAEPTAETLVESISEIEELEAAAEAPVEDIVLPVVETEIESTPDLTPELESDKISEPVLEAEAKVEVEYLVVDEAPQDDKFPEEEATPAEEEISAKEDPKEDISEWLAEALEEEVQQEPGLVEVNEIQEPLVQPEDENKHEPKPITFISTLDIIELSTPQFFYHIREKEIDAIHEKSISWRISEGIEEKDEESETRKEEAEDYSLGLPEPDNPPKAEEPVSQIVLEELPVQEESLMVLPASEKDATPDNDQEVSNRVKPTPMQRPLHDQRPNPKLKKPSSTDNTTGNTGFGWKAITGIGVGFFSLVAIVLLFIFQDGPKETLTQDDPYLTAFDSGQSFNILLLPFRPYPNCQAPEAIDESAVRDRLKILKESEDMGIKVAFINESACPQSSEEAKRIGEVYNADLVVWGNYPLARKDSSRIHVRYVSIAREMNLTKNYWANLGKRALSDIFELQEGKVGGTVEDIIYWILGIVHLRNEKYQSALTYLNQIEIHEDPEYSSVYHMLAKCYQGMERFDQVLEAYNKAILLNPEDANAYYNRGTIYQILRQNDQALADYLEAIRINPRHIKAHYNRKIVAAGSVKEDLYIDPKLVEQQLPKIREPESFAQEVEAEKEAASKANEEIPASSTETEATLAVQTEFEEDPNEEIESGPAFTYHNLGYQYEQKGQLNEAIYAYTRAIQTDPAQIKSVYSRAALYEKMGKFNQALEDYTAAIQLDSRNLDLYYSRAYLYERMKKYYEAISDYSKIIQLNNKLSNPFLYRGKAYQYVKQNDKALQDFEQAITLNPENATCYFFRARLKQDLGQKQEALDDYNRAIEINTGYASAYRERGELLASFKKYDQALADFDQVLKSNPHDARIYAKRGDVLIQLGQYVKAEADIREAIKLDPKNQRYQDLLAQINGNG